MKNLLSIFVAVLGVATAPLHAEPIKVDMVPGLWENKVVWGSGGAEGIPAIQPDQVKFAMEEMKKQLANMPPEQRKQMEAMMAQSGMKVTDDGVSFNNNQVEISPTGTHAKLCITQAQIDRGELPDDVKGCESVLKKSVLLSLNRPMFARANTPELAKAKSLFIHPSITRVRAR